MNPIKIKTKTKKHKSIEFIGDFISDKSMIIIDVYDTQSVNLKIHNDISSFISSLQKNQKLELHIAYVSGTYEKLGNIKNLFINDADALEFEASFIKQTQEESPETIDTKTSLQIFCDKWQRFDKGIDFHSIIRSVFQIDPRMSFAYNFKSDAERKEILEFAAELIHKKIEEL